MSRNFFSHPVITDSRYQRTLNRGPECVWDNKGPRDWKNIFALWFRCIGFFSVYLTITRGKSDVRCTAVFERGSLILAYRGSIVLENFFSAGRALISSLLATLRLRVQFINTTLRWHICIKSQWKFNSFCQVFLALTNPQAGLLFSV